MTTVHIFRGKDRQWYVRHLSRNGQVLTVSEGYVTRWNARRAAAKMFPGVPVHEVEK